MKTVLYSSVIFFLLLFSNHCVAQEEGVTTLTRVLAFNPGFSFEHPVGRRQTLHWYGGIGLTGGLGYSFAFDFLRELKPDPFLLVEYRYYVGWKSRQENGKRTAMNSADYIAPFIRTSLPERNYADGETYKIRRKPLYAFGATIGMQRNYMSRFSLDMNIGFGHTIEPAYTDDHGVQTANNSQFYFPGRISLGIWLNKRKK